MPQPPFLLDVLQIAPGSGNTLTISRDSSTGSIRFVDNLIASGVNLSELVGIRNVTGVYIVGRGGEGAPYTSIQSAIDSIPDSSDLYNPSLVLVLPGVYEESVVVDKDGVHLVGIGGASISSDSVSTLKIKASLQNTPKDVSIRGLLIKNSGAGGACIRISGADTFASATVTVNNSPLSVGDIVTIDGTNLTGVIGSRTPGANNFSVSGVTTDAIAAEIAAAINDPANSFSSLVSASPILNGVNLSAVEAGSSGNTITLSVSTNPVGRMTSSGPTFTGGGAAGSMVGDGVIAIENCNLVVSGTALFQISAVTTGHISVMGGSWRGSSSISSTYIHNCARFLISDVEWINDVEFSYDTSDDRPNDTSCDYVLHNCGRVKDVLSNLQGEGILKISSCPEVGDTASTGDRPVVVLNSNLEAVELSGTVDMSLRQSTRTSASVVSGTPTLSEPIRVGVASFNLSSSEVITFDVPQPDTNYVVLLETQDPGVNYSVTSKTTSGFTIGTSSILTEDVGYSVMRVQ